jgi:hypothetical protein
VPRPGTGIERTDRSEPSESKEEYQSADRDQKVVFETEYPAEAIEKGRRARSRIRTDGIAIAGCPGENASFIRIARRETGRNDPSGSGVHGDHPAASA